MPLAFAFRVPQGPTLIARRFNFNGNSCEHEVLALQQERGDRHSTVSHRARFKNRAVDHAAAAQLRVPNISVDVLSGAFYTWPSLS
jgi:hypothetical protein